MDRLNISIICNSIIIRFVEKLDEIHRNIDCMPANKVRILIVEDSPIIAMDLEARLTQMDYLVVGVVASGEEALTYFEEKKCPDLVIMDINLAGEIDGIATAIKIKENHPDCIIIFLTGSIEDNIFQLAKQSVPAAFLTKPYKDQDLYRAIDLALLTSANIVNTMANIEKTDIHVLTDRIFIKSNDKMQRIMLDEILWIQADDYYCKIVTKDKEILAGQTLKKMQELLSFQSNWFRIHRSYLVNLNVIEEINGSYISIKNYHIPYSQATKGELLSRIQKI